MCHSKSFPQFITFGKHKTALQDHVHSAVNNRQVATLFHDIHPLPYVLECVNIPGAEPTLKNQVVSFKTDNINRIYMEMIGNGTGSLTECDFGDSNVAIMGSFTLHPLPSSVRKKVSTDQRNSTVTRSGMLKSCKGSTLFDSYEVVTCA